VVVDTVEASGLRHTPAALPAWRRRRVRGLPV